MSATTAELLADIVDAVAAADAKHGPIHSLHEGYDVLAEEVHEFFLEMCKQSPDPAAVAAELRDIIVVCLRIRRDCLPTI